MDKGSFEPVDVRLGQPSKPYSLSTSASDIVGLQVARVGIDALEPYDARLVDHDHGPQGSPHIRVEHAVGLCNLTVRVEIAQNGVRNAAQRRGKGGLDRLGVSALIPSTWVSFSPRAESAILKEETWCVSAACKRVDVERQDDVLLASL